MFEWGKKGRNKIFSKIQGGNQSLTHCELKNSLSVKIDALFHVICGKNYDIKDQQLHTHGRPITPGQGGSCREND